MLYNMINKCKYKDNIKHKYTQKFFLYHKSYCVMSRMLETHCVGLCP